MLRPRPLPSGFVPPLRPSLVAEPPAGDDWLHEIKHDGFRTLVSVAEGRVRAFTRNGHDWTQKYPRIVAAAAALRCRSALIDGEAIVQDASGVSDFPALCRAIERHPQRIVHFAFDLLMLDGRDFRARPLEERRARLEELLGADPHAGLQFSAAVAGDGAKVFAAAEKLGLEGIVSKRPRSKYRSGRTRTWLKTKSVDEGDFVVIGTERRPGVPALALLAREAGGGLAYAGSAFVTLKEAEREKFWRRAEALQADRPTLAGFRRKHASWCRPELRVHVRHLRGGGEYLRHAALIGMAG